MSKVNPTALLGTMGVLMGIALIGSVLVTTALLVIAGVEITLLIFGMLATFGGSGVLLLATGIIALSVASALGDAISLFRGAFIDQPAAALRRIASRFRLKK